MDVVDLWAFAFDLTSLAPVGGSHVSRENERIFIEKGCSYLVGAFDDGRLAAVAACIDFDLHLGDRWVKASGIAGVATYPEYRRQRLVNLLLTDCLKKLHANKVAVASLWPFSYPFYERMGWAVTDMQNEVEVSLSSLRGIQGDAHAYKTVEPANLAPVMAMHERWSEQLNLSIRRNEYRWKELLQDPVCRHRLFIHQDGYMLWNVGQSTENTLLVREWCYLSDKAFVDGLTLLSHMDTKQFGKAKLLLPELETVLRLGGMACAPDIRVRPGMMSRVVNLEAFLAALPGRISHDIDLIDPLGVTAPTTGNFDPAKGPGALVQHVTSFWKTPNPNFPENLYGIAAAFPPFSVERY